MKALALINANMAGRQIVVFPFRTQGLAMILLLGFQLLDF
jgi:hypothetical protein